MQLRLYVVLIGLVSLFLAAHAVDSKGDITCTHNSHRKDYDGYAYVCPPKTMLSIANSYLASQVSQQWTDFIPHVADDITVGVVSVEGYMAQGKAAAEALFMSLGKVMQSIDKVVIGPKNWIRHDGVVAFFTKTQRSLSMNIAHNLTFMHMITFNSQCQVTDITEVADLLKTEDNFPLGNGNVPALYCTLIATLCAGIPINWGDAKDCYHHWMNAPQWVKDPETLKVNLTSFSLSCVGKIVDSVQSAPAVAPLMCPQLGAPIQGVAGCW